MQSSLRRTGEGYWYFRDRAGEADVTVYEHQLNALLEYDAADVFDPDTHVHHENHVRCDNRPENLTLVDADEHAEHHLLDRPLVPDLEPGDAAPIPGEVP